MGNITEHIYPHITTSSCNSECAGSTNELFSQGRRKKYNLQDTITKNILNYAHAMLKFRLFPNEFDTEQLQVQPNNSIQF